MIMEKKIQLVFVIAILLVLAVPLLKFNRTGIASAQEKRFLAESPRLIVDGRPNRNLFAECSSWLDDRFGLRENFVSLDRWARYTVLHGQRHNKIALEGMDGWYFYISKEDGDNYSDFMKKNLLNQAERDDFRRRVSDVVSWCEGQGIKVLFVIGPNKHSIYEEFYPFSRPEGMSRADQLMEVLDSLDVPYVFPRDYIISKKTDYDFPLYYETGTHWNPQGAWLASVLVKDRLIETFPSMNFPDIQYRTELSYHFGDDIENMLGIKAQLTCPECIPVGHSSSDFYEYLKNEGRKGVHTKANDKTLPRAIVFRDSFFSALEPFVSPLFSETEYIWKQFDESDKEHVLDFGPDIIIFESVERYLPSIIR